jgi:hypothetical protein
MNLTAAAGVSSDAIPVKTPRTIAFAERVLVAAVHGKLAPILRR